METKGGISYRLHSPSPYERGRPTPVTYHPGSQFKASPKSPKVHDSTFLAFYKPVIWNSLGPMHHHMALDVIR